MTIREQLIQKAFHLLNAGTYISKGLAGNRYIPKTSKGYISSLGGSIVQAGLLQSVIFFEDKGEGRDEIIKALVQLIKDQFPARYPPTFGMDGTSVNLGKYLSLPANNYYSQRQQLTKDIGEAAIALKMAMRMFEFK
jgi:hypothetical protein